MPATATPVLKCEEEIVFKVGYSDLERYIQQLTGKRIEIPAILECGNDTDHDIEVGHHPDWMDEEDKKEAEAFLFGDAKDVPTYHLQDLMETMCLHGMLKKGTYIIRVSW